MEAINVGPFAVSVRLGLFIVAGVVALFVGNRIAKRKGGDIERSFWIVLLVALVSARLAFVLMYREAYGAEPWTLFDLRDGGFNAVVGVQAGLAAAVILAWRDRTLRAPLLAALFSGSVVWVGATAAFAVYDKPQPLPSIALRDLNGREVSLASLAGRPVIINVWATWCPPCRREMPVLRDGQQDNPDIAFIFANQGESAETIRHYLATENLDLKNVLIDANGVVARTLGSVALPSTFFFDKNGMHVGTRIGELSAATLAQRVQALKAGE